MLFLALVDADVLTLSDACLRQAKFENNLLLQLLFLTYKNNYYLTQYFNCNSAERAVTIFYILKILLLVFFTHYYTNLLLYITSASIHKSRACEKNCVAARCSVLHSHQIAVM